MLKQESRYTRLQRKQMVLAMLRSRDLLGVRTWAREDRTPLSVLISLLFVEEDLVRWRAIEALGLVAGDMAKGDKDRVRSQIVRLLWSMNDESGAFGRYAPEAIGEILVHVPSLAAEFVRILVSFLKVEPLKRGVHWALARLVTTIEPSSLNLSHLAKALRKALIDPDPFVVGHALISLSRIHPPSGVESAKDLIKNNSEIILYNFNTGEPEQISVGQIAQSVLAESA